MNQPPQDTRPGSPAALWRRPHGVAPGTWQYVNERAIADHYDAFVADTPLCQLDAALLDELLPGPGGEHDRDVSRPTILDLGCGSGRNAIPLAERGYHVIGIDLSLPMLQACRRKLVARASETPAGATRTAPAKAPGRVELLHGNLVQLDFLTDQMADHAVCLFSTLGMIQGREARAMLLQHVRRLIRPGGLFVLHVHNRWADLRQPGGAVTLLRSGWKALTHRDVQWGDRVYAYRGLRDMFMHRFSSRELRRDLRHAGWQVVRWQGVSIDGASCQRGLGIPGGFLVVCTPGRSRH